MLGTLLRSPQNDHEGVSTAGLLANSCAMSDDAWQLECNLLRSLNKGWSACIPHNWQVGLSSHFESCTQICMAQLGHCRHPDTSVRLVLVAYAGLGTVAIRSLQQQFDGAIACMRLLHTHTASAAAALDAISRICLDPALRGRADSQIDQVAFPPAPHSWCLSEHVCWQNHPS